MRRRGLVRFGEQVARRVLLVATHQAVDRAVERGREEEGLARLGGLVEQLLHDGQESHVGHAVGFVDDDHLDLVEEDLAPFDEVDEATRTGDEDVDASPERLELEAEAGPAVHGGDAQLARAAEPLELAAHLGRELAGRDEHETAGVLRAGLADAGREGDTERDRLPRAGGGAAAEVATGQAVGEGHRLDVERGLEAARVEGSDEIGGDAELGKVVAGHDVQNSGVFDPRENGGQSGSRIGLTRGERTPRR